MSDQQVDEFDYMAEEHDVADFVEVDDDYYARDDGNIGMEDYDHVSNASLHVALITSSVIVIVLGSSLNEA